MIQGRGPQRQCGSVSLASRAVSGTKIITRATGQPGSPDGDGHGETRANRHDHLRGAHDLNQRQAVCDHCGGRQHHHAYRARTAPGVQRFTSGGTLAITVLSRAQYQPPAKDLTGGSTLPRTSGVQPRGGSLATAIVPTFRTDYPHQMASSSGTENPPTRCSAPPPVAMAGR